MTQKRRSSSKTYSKENHVEADQHYQRSPHPRREDSAQRHPQNPDQAGQRPEEMPDDEERDDQGAQQQKPGAHRYPRQQVEQRGKS